MYKRMRWLLPILLCLPLVVLAEAPVYRNEAYGLSFALPDGWFEIPDEDLAAFSGPGGSDMLLLISLTGQDADDGFILSFDAATAEKWIREGRLFEDIVFTEFTPILFASAVGADGRLYAFHSCRFAGEGFPDDYALFYMQFFFTDENGELGSVSLMAPAIEASNSILEWFDGIAAENIPRDVLAELNAQVM